MTGKPIGDRAMTATERQRRWRQKVRRQKLLAGKRDRAALRPPRAADDREQDLWSTPPCLTAALTEFVLPTLPADVVWEAAAGAGVLVDALRAAGREVIASDSEPQQRDIVRLDYLLDAPLPATRGAVMITNPPFSKLTDFINRTLELLDAGHLAGAVLLVRMDFAGTDGRAAALNRAMAEWECCWRARWIPGSTGNPRWWCLWVTWLAGRSGPPTHERLRRSNLSRHHHPIRGRHASSNSVTGNLP
jgi:hypothetical protein